MQPIGSNGPTPLLKYYGTGAMHCGMNLILDEKDTNIGPFSCGGTVNGRFHDPRVTRSDNIGLRTFFQSHPADAQ